jgi:hypothetical protein
MMKMMKVVTILPLALMLACGDKDEQDSGSDSGVVEEGGDTGGAE